MNKNKASLKQKILLFSASCLVVVVFLLLGEVYARVFTRINFLDNSRGLFAANRYGGSYGNTPNFEGISFGEKFNTDENGFRIDPQYKSKASPEAPAILVIGDSVGFGTGVTEQATIAGQLRRALPETNVYNASSIGYDTFDYKNVVGDVVSRKPEIKTVLLFYCLNDVADASAQEIKYQLKSMPDQDETSGQSIVRYANDYLRSRSKFYLLLKNGLRDTGMIHFKNDYANYQRGDNNVERGLAPLAALKQQLDGAGIKLKVFVLPYEAQTRPDSPPEFLLPQKLVNDFLAKNNFEYYDAVSAFQKSPAPGDLFLYGDPMHLSESGNRLVAGFACEKLEPQCRLP